MAQQFSVLLSVYKGERPEYLQAALESIFNQSVFPLEVILVQDGILTDELYAVCSFYERQYDILKIVALEENVGLGKALQIGVLRCKYDLIARMDTDDITEKERFAIQLAEFEKDAELTLLGGYIAEFSDTPDKINGYRKVPLELETIKQYAKRRNPFNHVTVMFRKQAVLAAGNYQTMYLSEDYYLWYRMIKKGFKMKNLPIALVKVRADLEMVKRRGGIRYFWRETKLQRIFYRDGFIGIGFLLSNLLIRFLFRIMPQNFRGFLYKNILRRKNDT